MSLDVAADVTSLNSLSFVGMVCIGNQHLMPQKENVHSLARADNASSKFEFGLAIPKKSYSADISNGQLLKQETMLPPNQSQKGKQTCSKSVMWQDQSNNGISDITEDRCTKNQNTRLRIGADRKRTRIFKSFSTPCRDCLAIEPTPSVKEQALQ